MFLLFISLERPPRWDYFQNGGSVVNHYFSEKRLKSVEFVVEIETCDSYLAADGGVNYANILQLTFCRLHVGYYR